MLTMAHQTHQFDIAISITDPYPVSLDLIESIYPSIQSDLDVFVGIAKEIAGDDLSFDELVLVVLLKGLLIGLMGGWKVLDGWSLCEIVFEIGDGCDALVH